MCIKIDMALNNLQMLICHKTRLTNQQKNPGDQNIRPVPQTPSERSQATTEWNDKIVVLKKTPLQLCFKTFIEKKTIQVTWFFSRADIYSM